MKRLAFYFGSFNPIHNGHLMLAEWCRKNTAAQDVVFVLSPMNPFKVNAELAPDSLRLEWLERASENAAYSSIFFSGLTDIEFSLPKPSYTIDTFNAIESNLEKQEIALIIGADNVENFDKWKNYQEILDRYSVFVYPREGCDISESIKKYPKMVYLKDAPLFNVSSTQIRNMVRNGESIERLVPEQISDEVVKFYNNL